MTKQQRHLGPYRGDTDETEDLSYSEAKRGTTAFHAYVVSIVNWGTKIKNELSEGWSREIEHDLTREFDGHEFVADLDDNARFDEVAPVRGE